MINIVCLKWGDKYGPEYVNRLYAMIKRHTTRPFVFWCFTERPEHIHREIKTHALPRSGQLDSWWNKLWLFSEEIPISQGEPIFYVDLDTLIVNNIDHLLSAGNQPMVVLKDFLHGIAQTAGQVGSGLMSWRHGDYIHVWHKFIANPRRAIQQASPHGDQWWVEHCIPQRQYWQDLFPNQVLSFKVHCLSGLPAAARVVCYHGKPSVLESATQSGRVGKYQYTAQQWVKDHWRE